MYDFSDTIEDTAPPNLKGITEPEEEEQQADYSKGIPWLVDVNSGNPIKTDLTGETRFGIFGPTGSGKTTVIKNLSGSVYNNDMPVVHISDMKNDFQKVNKYGGIGQQFIDRLGLPPGEEPFEMQRTFAVPNFIARNHYSGDPSQYGTRFAFGFQDIEPEDFMELLGGANLKENHRETLTLIFDDIDWSSDKQDLDENRWSKIIRLAEERSNKNSKLVRKLQSFRSKGVIDENMRRDILEGLNDKGAVILAFKYYRKYRSNNYRKLKFYSSMLQKKLLEKIEKNEVDTGNGLLLIADEFHILDDPKKVNEFNESFEDLLKIGARKANISTVIASQRPSQISNSYSGNQYDFLSDLTDVVMLRGEQKISEDDWKTVLRSMGIYRGKTDLAYCRTLFGSLNQYEGIYISSSHETPKDLQRVRSFAPPIHHPWED